MTRLCTNVFVIPFLSICLFLITSIDVNGQRDITAKDRHAIRAMAGCFNVDFRYSEMFAPDSNYDRPDDYYASGLELVEIIQDSGDKVVMQHLLIINDSTVIKHWRQDWVYEANRSFHYDSDNTWYFKEIPAGDRDGMWTQFVYQVDDGPRYSGTARWIHMDSTSLWQSISDSPLPRREYTKRSDYNLMIRGNRLHVKDDGWVHEQDNEKVIRSDGKDQMLAREKGYNTYTRISEEACQPARDWWAGERQKWNEIRKAWDTHFAAHERIKLKLYVDGTRLYEHLFSNHTDWDQMAAQTLIDQYVIPAGK